MKVQLTITEPGEKGDVVEFYGVPFTFNDGWFADVSADDAKVMVKTGRVVEVKKKRA